MSLNAFKKDRVKYLGVKRHNICTLLQTALSLYIYIYTLTYIYKEW